MKRLSFTILLLTSTALAAIRISPPEPELGLPTEVVFLPPGEQLVPLPLPRGTTEPVFSVFRQAEWVLYRQAVLLESGQIALRVHVPGDGSRFCGRALRGDQPAWMCFVSEVR